MNPIEDTPTPDLPSEYADKVAKDWAKFKDAELMDAMLPHQDNKQLGVSRIRIEIEKIVPISVDNATIAKLEALFQKEQESQHELWRLRGYEKAVEDMQPAIKKAQIQLVSELEGELPKKERIREGSAPNTVERKMTMMWNRGFNEAINQTAALLEHKKQELEGKSK